jgi:hypothetical protein
MNWEQLLSLKRQGDTSKRLRIEQDDTRLGFEVDYDRIFSAFRSLQDKTRLFRFQKLICTYSFDAQFRGFVVDVRWGVSWKENN